MRLKAIRNFKDKQENVLRKIGDEFECDDERGSFLLSLGSFVTKIDEVKKEVKEEVKEEAKEEVKEKEEKPKKKGE